MRIPLKSLQILATTDVCPYTGSNIRMLKMVFWQANRTVDHKHTCAIYSHDDFLLATDCKATFHTCCKSFCPHHTVFTFESTAHCCSYTEDEGMTHSVMLALPWSGKRFLALCHLLHSPGVTFVGHRCCVRCCHLYVSSSL